MKYWKIILNIFGLIPLGFIIPLLIFYFQVYQILGTWPIPSFNDPKNFEIYSDFAYIIYIAFPLWTISLLVWITLIGIYYIINGRETKWAPVFTSSIGHIVAILLTFSEIFEWFVD